MFFRVEDRIQFSIDKRILSVKFEIMNIDLRIVRWISVQCFSSCNNKVDKFISGFGILNVQQLKCSTRHRLGADLGSSQISHKTNIIKFFLV